MKYALFPRKDVFLIVIMLLWLAVIFTVIGITLSTSVSASDRLLPIYSVDTKEKEVAITFNCAWDDEGLTSLLQLLREEEVKCTFFFVGEFAEKYPEAVRKIYNEGHEIANHSMKHNDPVRQEYEEIVRDISRCNHVLYSLTGAIPSLYRAPSGSYDNKTIEAAQSLGMKVIQWDADSIDWKEPPPEKIISRVTQKVTNGSIVLFHLGKENTLEALPDIIAFLKAEGYSLIKVSDMLLEGKTCQDNEGKQKLLQP